MQLLSGNLIKINVYSCLTDSLEKLRGLLANGFMCVFIFINVKEQKKKLKGFIIFLYPCKSHSISYTFVLESRQE